MTSEELLDELLAQVSSWFSDGPRRLSNLKQEVFKNPDKYIEELSPPVYLLLKDNKYHKLIWDRAIVKGDLKLITKLDELGYKYDVNRSMKSASQGGYTDFLAVVDFFIEKGADDWDSGMGGATKGGHKDLIDFFIEKGAEDWNRGMAKAAGKGYKDLVDFFIGKGADWWDIVRFYSTIFKIDINLVKKTSV